MLRDRDGPGLDTERRAVKDVGRVLIRIWFTSYKLLSSSLLPFRPIRTGFLVQSKLFLTNSGHVFYVPCLAQPSPRHEHVHFTPDSQ